MIKYGTNNIGKIYFGSNLIGKAYFGSNLVYSSGSGPGPGPQPTGTPYLRGGHDGSYINTGITADNTVKLIIWARNFSPGSAWLCGSQTAVGRNSFGIAAMTQVDIDRIRIDYTNKTIYADNQTTNLLGYHKYELYQGTLKVDDVVVASTASTSFSNGLNIHLLGMNRNGTNAKAITPIDLCACQIYKNGSLVRDFTATQNGMYDAVSGSTFTNAGPGSLTYGTFDEGAYTPLEYIQCTNSQYIDTGIYGKGGMLVATKFRAIGTSVPAPRILGTYTPQSASTYFLFQLGAGNYPNRYAHMLVGSTSAYTLYDNSSTRLTGMDVTFYKEETTARLIRNNVLLGTAVTFSASNTTNQTLLLGSARKGDSILTSDAFNGYLYYAKFGAERCFVPAKVNGVAGFYDTYNNVFYPSISGTAFVAGPEL